MNKVAKFYLISKNDGIDYKTVCSYLWQLQRDTREIKNKAIQICWEYQNYSNKYKEENGIYPSEKEYFGMTLRGYLDKTLREQYGRMYSSNMSNTSSNAYAKFKPDLKEVLKGDKSIPYFKNDQPLEIHNKAIKLYFLDNKWMTRISLFSTAFKKENNLGSCSLDFEIIVKDKSQKVILERCFDELYHISASKMIYDKKKKQWVLHLCFSIPDVKKKELDKGNIMGIDLGIVYTAYMSFNNNRKRYKIEGGEIEEFRRRVERRKIQIGNQSKYCGEGRIGHGYHTRMKPMNDLSDKISNFRDTTNHKYSKYIVDIAIKNNCGTIQMEDLSGISSENKFLKNWSYYDLQQKIIYKANAVGIDVKLINPKFTSQRCSKCGHISKDNRPDQKTFKCEKCGFTTNADFNASQNIATYNIENIIKENNQ